MLAYSLPGTVCTQGLTCRHEQQNYGTAIVGCAVVLLYRPVQVLHKNTWRLVGAVLL